MRAPEPTPEQLDYLYPSEAWREGWEAGYKAALQTVSTVQPTPDVNAND